MQAAHRGNDLLGIREVFPAPVLAVVRQVKGLHLPLHVVCPLGCRHALQVQFLQSFWCSPCSCHSCHEPSPFRGAYHWPQP